LRNSWLAAARRREGVCRREQDPGLVNTLKAARA
jgi:hypothetical protein